MHGRQREIRLSGRDHRHYRFVVSGALTLFNIGWRNDFVMRWVVRLRHRLADRG
jgi:hypothetical protein